ncbi:MAG: hypothetical protein E3J86_13930, partial [Candidatus Thorarchaeota archaeon]
MVADYTPHDPIVITHDENFTQMAFPGDGTEEEPYLIEGLQIASPDGNSCIIIGPEITVNYEIRNCYLSGATMTSASGVRLLNQGMGTVFDCVFVN